VQQDEGALVRDVHIAGERQRRLALHQGAGGDREILAAGAAAEPGAPFNRRQS
jgi:hypothetical protein